MSWDSYFLEICDTVAKNSKCLSRHIGAIIVKDKSIISTGFNGPPRNVPHCNERYYNDDKLIHYLTEVKSTQLTNKHDINVCPRLLMGYKSGEGLEWCIASHAEDSAITNAAREGISVRGTSLYLSDCGILPCKNCFIKIINAGIAEVVCTDPTSYYDKIGEWLVRESGLIVRRYQGIKFNNDGTWESIE